ncbi:HFR089Cp [Eremothecium sinecaudum]|uniref:HFR089Cp n=1 Tax=Eremothecium sinecaudum TaxID=45286 RepID=A0A0X8HUV0_9SACH|nr:HFR089Cp [Eremothecium sinecaudum]AMD21944.1 HFR089Cp [Eremothecium sinecaudum]
MSMSVLDHVDGSAQYDTSTVSVLCSVTGPIEPKARQEISQHISLEIIVRPVTGPPCNREKFLEDKIRSVIMPVVEAHLHPRQLCQITFQVLKSVGHHEHLELAASLNAAYLALIDAAIPLKASFSAVSIAVNAAGENFVNPDTTQLESATSVFTIAFQVESDSISLLLLDSSGSFTEKVMFHVLELAEQECVKQSKYFRGSIKTKIEKDFIWKQR